MRQVVAWGEGGRGRDEWTFVGGIQPEAGPKDIM